MGNFSPEVIRLAQETESRYGVPASVTLAQYALESGYGTSKLAARSNNYFGISGSYNGKFTMSGGRKWRAYATMDESFHDHGRLLSSGRYAEATKGAASVGQYVDAIAEIYAPSSDGNNNYAGQLKRIITDNNLTHYDAGGFSGTGGSFTASAQPVAFNEYSIFGKVILIVVYVFLVVLAFILTLKAFDFSPKKAIVKAALKKTGVDDVLEGAGVS